MYIASAGIPLLNYRTCNEPTCHKSGNRAGSFHLKYLFPAWLFSVGLEIAGTWSGINGTGATLTFSIPRVISNYHYWDIANMIDDWSIDDFERYMYSNQISPNDVWEGGLTIFEVCHFQDKHSCYPRRCLFVKAVVDYHRHDIGFMLLDRGVNLHSLSHTAWFVQSAQQDFLNKALNVISTNVGKPYIAL
jgi:hypothetical protein